jgi:hypothetical protein
MIANQIAGLLTGGVPVSLTDYESIATVTVGAGGQATISFTSIPSTYSHLQLRYSAHSEGVGADYTLVNIRLNNDSGSNYVYHRLIGNGTAASANSATSQTAMLGTWIPDDLSMANSYGSAVVDVIDYTSVNKNTTLRILGGFNMNTADGLIGLFSGLWLNAAAVNRIDLTTLSGQDFDQYSSFALYGIK